MSPEQVAAQLDRTQDEVDRALGYHHQLTLVRPPYGGTSAALVDLLIKRGDELVLWSVDARDYVYHDDDLRIFRRLTGPAGLVARNGGVVLMHDTQSGTGVMLPDFLRELKRSGLIAVTASEAIEEKYVAPPLATCRP